MKLLTPLFVTLVALTAAQSQSSEDASATPSSTAAPSLVSNSPALSASNTVLQNINAAGSSTLAAALQLPKFATLQQLLNANNVTLFLPSESAVQQAISDDSLNVTTTQNTTNILSYHLVSGAYESNSFHSVAFLPTFFTNQTFVKLGGGPQVLGISVANSSPQVTNGITTANIVTKDIKCSNGMIQVIDTVLAPPKSGPITITQIPELETFANITQNNNLTGVLSSQQATIFAPNNGAWTKSGYLTQPVGILLRDTKYGVVRGVYRSTDLKTGTLTSVTGQLVKVDTTGGNATINGAHIVQSDILTSAGVIHIIDTVLDPTVAAASIDPSFSQHYQSTPTMIQSTQTPSAGAKLVCSYALTLLTFIAIILI